MTASLFSPIGGHLAGHAEPVAPQAVALAAEAVEATIGPRLRRMAAAMHEAFVATPLHFEVLRVPHRRRWRAAWKIVSHCGVVLAADISLDEGDVAMVARFNGYVVGISSDGAAALVLGLTNELNAVGICA